MLSQHNLQSPSGLTKKRRKKAGVSKLQLASPLLPPSGLNPCNKYFSVGSTGYERFPKTLQSRTSARQPINKRQKKQATAKRQRVQPLAFAETFSDGIHGATAKHVRYDAFDDTIARTLDSKSPQIELKTKILNAFYRTNDKGPTISPGRKNVGKRFTTAASIEGTQSQKLSFSDT